MTHSATRTNRAYEVLQSNVDEIRSSEQWARALAVQRRLHRYSFHNSFLIALQCPDATMVAGYRKWQELGRQVKKGERSIAIFAPMVKKVKDDDGEEKRKLIGFKAASVFDLSQTEGDEIPMPPSPVIVEGDDEAVCEAYENVEHYAESIGCSVEVVDHHLLGTAQGAINTKTKEIRLRNDLPPAQRLKTLIHEVAHAVQHVDNQERGSNEEIEVEAETIAYLVSDAIGLDTGCYSFAYVAGWAGESDALLKIGERAKKAADSIIEALTTPEVAS